MSDDSSARGPIARAHRISISREHLLVSVLLVLGVALYLHQTFQYFMHDDEGSYAYAAWRISVGEVPYRDFLSPQMPLFLYWGGLIVRLLGQSFAALRLGTIPLMLVAACLLYASNRELLGPPEALVSVGLFLLEPNVFHNARYFRPEALMLLFQLGGIYAFILAEKRGRTGYAVLSGALFGCSILSKLFGALPLAGCLLYLLYRWRRGAQTFRQIAGRGLAVSLPAVLIVSAVALLFSRTAPYVFTAVFGHHTMQGAGMPLLARAAKALALYRSYVTDQPLAILLAVVGAWLLLRRRQALPSLLVWQVPTVLVFVGLSRGLHQRHLTYLAPTLVTLMAVGLVWLSRLQRRIPSELGPQRAAGTTLSLVVVAGLVLGAAYPWLQMNERDAALQEQDSAHLASLIQALAPAGHVVLSDYPGLNFLAGRPSTYWAAGISGGAARSGQITGAALIEEIERDDVAAIVINTWGGAHQMADMGDYPEFLDYVGSHFVLAERYKCSYEPKVFELYARPENIPPELGSGPPPATEGGWIELHARLEDGLGGAAWEQLWTVVQWQDGTGAWHDVEGWQATPEASGDGEGGYVWSVSPTDLGAGPFRWLVLRGREGPLLAASEPFHLPAAPGETTRVELAVTP